jgi:hypothetical protein
MKPTSSPQCGALAFSSNARRHVADSVVQGAVVFSTSTIRRAWFSALQSTIEIEYG